MVRSGPLRYRVSMLTIIPPEAVKIIDVQKSIINAFYMHELINLIFEEVLEEIK